MFYKLKAVKNFW